MPLTPSPRPLPRAVVPPRPRRGRRGIVRRIAALVVLLSLTLFQAEWLVADVCDGDASAAELQAFAGAASDLSATATVGVPGARGENALAGIAADRGDRDAPSPGHTTHACHCVHAHAGVLSRIAAVTPVAVIPPSTVVGISERTPASIAPARRDRPPSSPSLA